MLPLLTLLMIYTPYPSAYVHCTWISLLSGVYTNLADILATHAILSAANAAPCRVESGSLWTRCSRIYITSAQRPRRRIRSSSWFVPITVSAINSPSPSTWVFSHSSSILTFIHHRTRTSSSIIKQNLELTLFNYNPLQSAERAMMKLRNITAAKNESLITGLQSAENDCFETLHFFQ